MRRRDFVTLLGGASESTKNPSVRAGIDEYHSEASVLLPTSAVEQQAPGPWGYRGRHPQCRFHQSLLRLFTRIETVSA
jgi:hypothetical protein